MSRTLSRASIDICADCSALDPSWVSINRGVLVCDGCCSVHLSLGRHVSQIKSLKKGSWSSQQLTMVHQLVSCGANNIWEYSLLDPSQNRQGRRKPNPRDPVYPIKADFIRAKYQFLAFVNKHKDSEVTLEDLNKQLHASVRTSNLETSLRLLAAGADPCYLHTEKGNTALHVATQAGQPSQIELLLVYGADPGAFDAHGRTPADIARNESHEDLFHRLVECQYELTDGLAFYLCSRRPDHRAGQHFIIPEMADSSLDLSELAKAAKKKLQALSNRLFEELAMDVYDEVDRRENETIWLSTQNHGSMLVSDRQTVPFLPANPEYSATRNQGRQKLAKFNKREFATLIIDILNDAKRRYAGTLSPTGNQSKLLLDKHSAERDMKLSVGGQRSASVGGGLSDDEPLYDSVCSDEDYASIGDNQSIEDDTSNSNKTVKPSSSRENVDVIAAGGAAAAAEHPITAPTKSSVPITVDEYHELKHALEESQLKMQQLMKSNITLGEEVAMLQNMVKKLVQENRLLRRGQSPDGVAPAVGGNGERASHNQVNSPAVTAASAAASRPTRWSMVESADSRKQLQGTLTNSVRDFPTPPAELLTDNAAAAVSSTSISSKESITGIPANQRIADADSAEVTPTENNTKSSTGDLVHGSATFTVDAAAVGGNSSSLPSQEEVVRKTEKITRNLQQLFHLAQEGKHDSYSACADKIHLAVTEMLSLFPQNALTSQISDVLHILVSGSESLRDQCRLAQNAGVGGHSDYRSHTQQVIKGAYDIALSAKQLVTLFE